MSQVQVLLWSPRGLLVRGMYLPKTGRNAPPRGLAPPTPGASIQDTDLAPAPLRHGAASLGLDLSGEIAGLSAAHQPAPGFVEAG